MFLIKHIFLINQPRFYKLCNKTSSLNARDGNFIFKCHPGDCQPDRCCSFLSLSHSSKPNQISVSDWFTQWLHSSVSVLINPRSSHFLKKTSRIFLIFFTLACGWIRMEEGKNPEAWTWLTCGRQFLLSESVWQSLKCAMWRLSVTSLWIWPILELIWSFTHKLVIYKATFSIIMLRLTFSQNWNCKKNILFVCLFVP